MSTHQQSYPCFAKYSIADESGRPGTSRSNVGCEAIEEPCTNRIVPLVSAGSPATLFQRKSLTSPLLVQCSEPGRRTCTFIRASHRHLDRRGSVCAEPEHLPRVRRCRNRAAEQFHDLHGLGDERRIAGRELATLQIEIVLKPHAHVSTE